MNTINNSRKAAKAVRATAGEEAPLFDRDRDGQVVLVFQGGGALGAYQVGVYQALQEAGIEPDWVIGTSIGAINAALIAGNRPEDRLERLGEFWARVQHSGLAQMLSAAPLLGTQLAHAMTMTGGLGAFFTPNPLAWLGPQWRHDPEAAAYYSTQPLRETLKDLIDIDRLNSGAPRLTVGTANVRNAEMRYFDSAKERLDIPHILASGALPPAFPAVRIDGELYWDGGILSNTPVEAVFDDNPRRNGLVFAVHMWSPSGPEPDSLAAVAARQKDLQYASRASSHITRQRQIHKLRHIISELASLLPEETRTSNRARMLQGYGCVTRMHVVRLLAPAIQGEDNLKDIDFSPAGIRTRWDAGYLDTRRVLAAKPWTHPCDPLEGFLLHEARSGDVMPDQPTSLT